MSEYKLKSYVHAVELDGKGHQTGRAQQFGPDDDLSAPENEWALAAISNPDVWDGDAPPRREAPAPESEADQLRARIAEMQVELAAARGGDQGRGSAPAAEPDRYDGMTAAQLGDELGKRDLPRSGSKPELVARLRADDRAKADQK